MFPGGWPRARPRSVSLYYFFSVNSSIGDDIYTRAVRYVQMKKKIIYNGYIPPFHQRLRRVNVVRVDCAASFVVVSSFFFLKKIRSFFARPTYQTNPQDKHQRLLGCFETLDVLLTFLLLQVLSDEPVLLCDVQTISTQNFNTH